MIHSEQYSLPLVLESANEYMQSISTYRRNQSYLKDQKQRNTTLNLSKSFHQDLTTNESEEDLLLNYSDIQQYILKECNSRNKKCVEIKRNIVNLSEGNSSQQSKHLSQAFYSRSRIIKSQNKFHTETSYLSQTPNKYSNLNVSEVINQTQNSSMMRRTVTAAHPSEINPTLKERVHTFRGGFGVNYSINKIKSSMKQSKESAKVRSFTISDSIAIEGRSTAKDKSFDQSLNQSLFPINIEKEFEKKKKVVYSRKSTSLGLSQSHIVEKQRQTEQAIPKKNDFSSQNSSFLNNFTIQGLQIDTTVKNSQISQSPSPRAAGVETPSFQHNQLSPLINDYQQQRYKPRKPMLNQFRRQNVKQRQDSINDLQSNHQQNYLALFPIKNGKPLDSPVRQDICEAKVDGIEINASVKQLFSQPSPHNIKPLKRQTQKFEFIHLNDLATNLQSQQVPTFQKNETLNRFYPKTFTQQRLKPIRIYGEVN